MTHSLIKFWLSYLWFHFFPWSKRQLEHSVVQVIFDSPISLQMKWSSTSAEQVNSNADLIDCRYFILNCSLVIALHFGIDGVTSANVESKKSVLKENSLVTLPHAINEPINCYIRVTCKNSLQKHAHGKWIVLKKLNFESDYTQFFVRLCVAFTFAFSNTQWRGLRQECNVFSHYRSALSFFLVVHRSVEFHCKDHMFEYAIFNVIHLNFILQSFVLSKKIKWTTLVADKIIERQNHPNKIHWYLPVSMVRQLACFVAKITPYIYLHLTSA